MSSRPTGTSSLTQKYCCRRREPQALCSRLKEIARLDSVAEKSLTGIDTSPNEILKEPIDRAAIGFSRAGGVHSSLEPPCLGERGAAQRRGPPPGAIRSTLRPCLRARAEDADVHKGMRSLRDAAPHDRGLHEHLQGHPRKRL